ncbi:hypothetical protein E6H24_03925 [Candidatus Bathyarchaeota archaeon]|nr:MAG: hypothetical protein E6H24_03925 [Candidatus Bathyarchaeota archaeon]
MLVSKDAIAKAVADMKGKSEKRKFNQSVELAVKLRELDLKRPEARINESIELPTPPNKTTKVAVIAGGDLAVRAKNAGADLVIGKDDLDKLGRDKKQARKRQRRNARLKMKDQPVIQCKVGTEDMPDDVLVQNIQTVISRLESKLERGSKNISSVAVKTTMGPLVKVTTTQV